MNPRFTFAGPPWPFPSRVIRTAMEFQFYQVLRGE